MACRSAVKWVHRLDADYSWDSPIPLESDYAFADRGGVVRLRLERSGRMTVTAGYSWDGCTPKLCVLDLHVGVPDGVVHAGTGRPKTYYASLIHDALYQFLPDGLPLSRSQADRCFLLLMERDDFLLRRVYWLAVRIFGGFFRAAGRGIRGTRGSRVA